MVIYLSHPIHGTKVAISEQEAAADEKNGWKRFDVQAQDTQGQETNVLAMRRPGRKKKEAA